MFPLRTARPALVAITALTMSACGVAVGATGTVPPTTLTPTERPALTVPAGADDVAETDGIEATRVATVPEGKERGRLVIHATGDVSVDPEHLPVLSAEGYGYALSGLDGLFAGDDLTIVNLECPVSDRGEPLEKEFVFRCDPAALPHLRDGGVDVVNLANNHVLDYGVDAMLDSLVLANEAGLAPVGVGTNEQAAHQPAVFEIEGWTVAVLGFGGVVPATDWLAGPDRPGMADGDTIETMVEAVRAADRVADLVLVTIHWGVELDTEPRQDDVERGRTLVEAGADAVFGHHSHRLNPLTFHEGKPIAWGLGNFVWPINTPEGADTAVARVIVEPDGSIAACLLAATIVTPGHPALDAPPEDGCP